MIHKGRREKKRFKECAEIVRAANTRGEPRSCSTMQTALSTLSRDLRRPSGEIKKRVTRLYVRVCNKPQQTQRQEEGVARGGRGFNQLLEPHAEVKARRVGKRGDRAPVCHSLVTH